MEYCAIVVPMSGDPYAIKCATAVLLADELKKLYGTRVWVFPYQGKSWAISKGPTNRFLLGPGGERIPLFQQDDLLDIDHSGSLYNGTDAQV